MNFDGNIVPIETLYPGETAIIHDMHGDQRDVNRLEEMGVRSGSQILLKKQCNGKPGGSLVVNIDGRDLMIRCGHAVMILVAVSTAAAC